MHPLPVPSNTSCILTFRLDYSAEGVDALNKKVVNECGGFTSTASMQGNQLTIHIIKEYSHHFEPAANWPKMLAFIDAAADFTNAKLLLKKN